MSHHAVARNAPRPWLDSVPVEACVLRGLLHTLVGGEALQDTANVVRIEHDAALEDGACQPAHAAAMLLGHPGA
eukprot:4669964-Alexandrium_andersonii.AAC.1